MPIVCVLRPCRERAMRLGWEPNFFAAAFTLSRVAGGIERPGALFNTKETVAGLRSRCSASIFRLTRRALGGGVDGFLGIGGAVRTSLADARSDRHLRE